MSLAGKTICFTGTLAMKRADATKAAEAAGAKVGGSVTGKTDILVAGPGAGAKEDAARAKGVDVWTEAQFAAAIGGGGAPPAAASSSSATSSSAGGKKKKAEPPADDKPTPKKAKAAPASAPSTPAASTSAAQAGATPTGLRTPGVDRGARDLGASVHADYDAKLNQAVVDGPVNSNKFYVLQVLKRGPLYACWNRWGRVGEEGQTNANKLSWGSLDDAVKVCADAPPYLPW